MGLRWPGIHVDDKLTRHFFVRDAKSYGFFGFYPDGKLVCFQEKEFLKKERYKGKDEPAKAFREIVMKTKMLGSKEAANHIGEALDTFLNAVKG